MAADDAKDTSDSTTRHSRTAKATSRATAPLPNLVALWFSITVAAWLFAASALYALVSGQPPQVIGMLLTASLALFNLGCSHQATARGAAIPFFALAAIAAGQSLSIGL